MGKDFESPCTFLWNDWACKIKCPFKFLVFYVVNNNTLNFSKFHAVKYLAILFNLFSIPC